MVGSSISSPPPRAHHAALGLGLDWRVWSSTARSC